MNRMILLIFVVIIGFCLLTEGWKKGRRHKKKKVTKFMHVSDIHFDLFYNQSITLPEIRDKMAVARAH